MRSSPFHISSQVRSKLTTILLITVAWSFVSLILFLQGYSALLQFNCGLGGYSPYDFLIGALITSLTAGLIGGTLMVFVWDKWLRSKPYNRAILSILVTYTVAYFAVDAIAGFYARATTPELATGYIEHLLAWQTLASYLVWGVIVISTFVALLVKDKYGPGVFRSFLMGKYFHPRREERTIMFLDLRASTAIAEFLGEEKYFRFVRDVFRIATPPMLRHGAEIYQYVGDEVVLTWPGDAGLRDHRCVTCFYSVEETLQGASRYFRSQYDVTPEFKAGLHHGSVMVGEVGVVKREIAYSGDVMNTTARIQARCNDFGVNLLLSGVVHDRLPANGLDRQRRQLGAVRLRGKQEQVPLYTV
jgi:adenylate cyclase